MVVKDSSIHGNTAQYIAVILNEVNMLESMNSRKIKFEKIDKIDLTYFAP